MERIFGGSDGKDDGWRTCVASEGKFFGLMKGYERRVDEVVILRWRFGLNSRKEAGVGRDALYTK